MNTWITTGICLALSAGLLKAAEKEVVKFNFNGGEGKPRLIKREEKLLDGKEPFSRGPTFLFRLAPQDNVILDVIDCPRTLTGKTLAHMAKFVRKKKGGGLFGTGLFAKEERQEFPDRNWSKLPKTLELGKGANEVRVVLEVRYAGNKKDVMYFKPGEKIDYILPRPGDVYVYLKVPANAVAWKTDQPSPQDSEEIKGHMNQRKNAGRYHEAHMLKTEIQKGNIGDIQAQVIAKRKQ